MNTQIAYQQAAVRNASAVELVIMLYDIMVRDLQQAIEAMHANHIELRTARLKHALLVLEQLEGSLNMDAGGSLAANLSRLYSLTRKQIMDAQMKRDPEILREMVRLLLDVRGAWAQVNNSSAPAADQSPVSPYASPESGVPSFSWQG